MGRFTRYEFVQRIALGGMAEVWAARAFGKDGSAADVVVKRILPQLAGDEKFQSMLLEEAEVTAHLRHANIVEVHDWGHLDDTCFLAMERVDGLDGRQLLDACNMRGQRIPPAVALHAAAEVARALDFAHHRRDARGNPLGIVHRDVSPSNILFSTNGAVKLSDFGIARAKTRASYTQVGQVRGKPRYMSPEQARGQELDGRSDLFSLGLVLHELLTGKPVFPASNYLDDVIAVIQRGIPPPSQENPDLPAGLDDLVLALCERDLDRRFPAGAAAAEAIEGWALRHKMRLQGGAVAELVLSIVRPTAVAERSRDRKVETRIVRLEDLGGVSRFTTETGAALDANRPPSDTRGTSPSGPAVTTRPTPVGATRVMASPISSDAVPLMELPVEDNRGEGERTASTGVAAPPSRAEEDGPTSPGPGRRVAASPPAGGRPDTTARRPSVSRASQPHPLYLAGAAALLVAVAGGLWAARPSGPFARGTNGGATPLPTLDFGFAIRSPVETPDGTPLLLDPPEPEGSPIGEETPARAATRPERTPAPAPPGTPRVRPSAIAVTTKAAAAASPSRAAVLEGTGWLTLRSTPSGEVTIDGIWAGATPLSRHELPAGDHVVVVNSEDGRRAEATIRITPDRVTSRTLTLE